jgi:hypothetical protein
MGNIPLTILGLILLIIGITIIALCKTSVKEVNIEKKTETKHEEKKIDFDSPIVENITDLKSDSSTDLKMNESQLSSFNDSISENLNKSLSNLNLKNDQNYDEFNSKSLKNDQNNEFNSKSLKNDQNNDEFNSKNLKKSSSNFEDLNKNLKNDQNKNDEIVTKNIQKSLSNFEYLNKKLNENKFDENKKNHQNENHKNEEKNHQNENEKNKEKNYSHIIKMNSNNSLNDNDFNESMDNLHNIDHTEEEIKTVLLEATEEVSKKNYNIFNIFFKKFLEKSKFFLKNSKNTFLGLLCCFITGIMGGLFHSFILKEVQWFHQNTIQINLLHILYHLVVAPLQPLYYWASHIMLSKENYPNSI